jgi:hypothetical protein
MRVWVEFWRVWLIISGITFAGITVIVAWKGHADLRAMFRDLGAEKGSKGDGRERRT